jgi:hypothetical protein
MEKRISDLESEILAAEESLANFVSVEQSQRLSDKLGEQRAALDSAMSDWEELTSQIETTV